MHQLIVASLESRDISALVALPPFLLNPQENEYVDFIFQYRKKHHTIPTLTRFLKSFPTFVVVKNDEGFPLSDLRESFVDHRKSSYIINRCNEIAAAVREGEMGQEDATQALNVLLRDVKMSSTVISTSSTFDRTRYFRTGSMLSTGLKMIDTLTKGLYDGEVFLIAARLGIGKSTMLFFMMADWIMQGKKVLCISKEMPETDVFARVDSVIGGFNPLLLRDATMKTELMGKLGNVVAKIIDSKGELVIPSGGIYTPMAIQSLAVNIEPDVIVVDGVYLLSPSQALGRQASGWESMAKVSREIKQMALDLNKPVVSTTQLKRVGDKEEFNAEDIAYSDALGQDADFVTTLRRLPKETETSLPKLECNLIKNRFGGLGGSLFEISYNEMTRKELLLGI